MVNDSALQAIHAFYGPLPPRGTAVTHRLVHRLDLPSHELSLWRLQVSASLGWTVHLAWPHGLSQAAVLLSPDGCWPQVIHPQSLQAVLSENVALAWFNRTDLAFDRPDGQREGPVHDHWPEQPWSAIAAWAWGLNQTGQMLSDMLAERQLGLGCVGHSRGGKAALVAGALDERWDAVISHNSGTGGASSLQNPAPGAESLADLAARFAHWLSPKVTEPAAQQALVDKDAPWHWLRAIAPRGLCLLQAEDDAWANPEGTRRMAQSLQAEWAQAPEHLQCLARAGGHAMTPLDWQRAARFLRGVVERRPDRTQGR